MFEKGDKYIHFTKYGGVNKGEVESFGYINIIGNGVAYKKPYIKEFTDGNLVSAKVMTGTAGCERFKKPIMLTVTRQIPIDVWKGTVFYLLALP
jgi:hypothetical protein